VQLLADVIPPNRTPKLKQLAALLRSGERNSRMPACAGEAQFGQRFQGAQDRQRAAWQIRALSGSLSFVAVVQSSDLQHRHDGPPISGG